MHHLATADYRPLMTRHEYRMWTTKQGHRMTLAHSKTTRLRVRLALISSVVKETRQCAA
jgi:hypothetical protein